MKFSIIIPTYNHFNDLLKPCLDSIIKCTELDQNIEIIIVANGCTDETENYVSKLNNNFKLLSYSYPMGYSAAINAGLEKSTGDYIVLLNNDTIILDKNWLNLLYQPLIQNKDIGITGPLKANYGVLNVEFLLFFCVMIKREVINTIGYLDERFSPGGYEDLDYCTRTQEAGFKICQVPYEGDIPFEDIYAHGSFPIYHLAEGTINDDKDKWKEIYIDNINKIEHKYKNIIHIITPTYNRHKQLLELLEYINKQTYRNIRCWICSDGYDSEVEKIINNHRKISKDIEYNFLFTENRLGKWGAPIRQKILNLIREEGKVVFVDDDNVIYPSYINNLFDKINNEYGISYCNILLENQYTNGQKIIIPGREGEFTEQYIDSLNFMVNAKIAKQCCEMWNEEYCHDYKFIKKCNELTKSIYIEDILGEHRYMENLTPNDLVYQQETQIDNTKLNKFKQDMIGIYNIQQSDVENKIIIDIGANIGAFSLACYDMGAREIFAFEPDNYNFPRLEDNVRNKEDKIHIFKKAVYDESINFINMNGEDQSAFVVPDESGKIPTITLEDIINMISLEQDDAVLKIDCEGSEYPILLSSSRKNIRKFKIIYAEVHSYPLSEHNPQYLFDYIKHMGYRMTNQSWTYETRKEEDKEITRTMPHEIYKFERLDNNEKNTNVFIKTPVKASVTAVIPTKDRYFTTLPLTLISLLNQTVLPEVIKIYDDGQHLMLTEIPMYQYIFKMIEDKQIKWMVNFSDNKGQVACHQNSIETSDTEWIYRIDDDNVLEPNVLQNLLNAADEKTGAVAGLVIDPTTNYKNVPTFLMGRLTDVILGHNIQWYEQRDIREVQHLYSSFIYRRKAAKHGYCPFLSVVGHREETIFSHEMYRNGWKLIVTPNAITWHLRNPEGGIRSVTDSRLWQEDENIFKAKIDLWQKIDSKSKVIVLDSGLGDHYAFKHILPELKEKYKDNLVMAVCYPEVFADYPEIPLISISDAHLYFNGGLDRFNAYKFMIDENWNDTIVEAYRKFYIERDGE